MQSVFSQEIMNYVDQVLVTRAADNRYLSKTVSSSHSLSGYFQIIAETYEGARATLLPLIRDTDKATLSSLLGWIQATQQIFYEEQETITEIQSLGDRALARKMELMLALQHGILVEITRICGIAPAALQIINGK